MQTELFAIPRRTGGKKSLVENEEELRWAEWPNSAPIVLDLVKTRHPPSSKETQQIIPPAPENVLSLGLNDHFQVSGVFDDLLGQLCGWDGGILRLLLLAAEGVIVIWAQQPAPLLRVLGHLL